LKLETQGLRWGMMLGMGQFPPAIRSWGGAVSFPTEVRGKTLAKIDFCILKHTDADLMTVVFITACIAGRVY